MKKRMRLLVSGAALSLLPLSLTVNQASAWGGTGYECTSLSNGDLCVRIYHASSGYSNQREIEVDYSKYSGSSISLKGGVNLPNGTLWASSYSSLSAGSTYRAWFDDIPFDSGCPSVVGVIQVSGQGQFATPPQTICEYY